MLEKIRGLTDKARGRLVMLAHEDRGSSTAETVLIAAIFIAIAIVVGKVFGNAIVDEANKVAKQITSQ